MCPFVPVLINETLNEESRIVHETFPSTSKIHQTFKMLDLEEKKKKNFFFVFYNVNIALKE